MSDLYRAEIISNQSVQDDITELLEQEIPCDSLMRNLRKADKML